VGTPCPKPCDAFQSAIRADCLCFGSFVPVPPDSRAAVGSDRCFVCGGFIITGTVYLLKDQVTLEKVEVCSNCENHFPDCYWCGIPADTNAPGFVLMPDARAICARDARTVVVKEDEVIGIARQVRNDLDRLLSRFLSLPETNIVFGMVDRVHLEDLFKIAGRDYRCPNVWGYTESITNNDQLEHDISLLSGLPRSWLLATCAHELTHAWVAEHVSTARKASLARDAQEGFCELVAFTSWIRSMMKSRRQCSSGMAILVGKSIYSSMPRIDLASMTWLIGSGTAPIAP